MKDYDGSLDYFQKQLTARGISKSQLNINDYNGLTKDELQYIVDNPEKYMTPAMDVVWDEIKVLKKIIPSFHLFAYIFYKIN